MRLSITAGLVASSLYAVAPAAAADVTCNGLAATIVGTPGDDTFVGTPGDDVIVTLGGHDHVDAGLGNDVVCLGDGNDRGLGGDGTDLLDGEAGNDELMSDEWAARHHWTRTGRDHLYGGDGNDTIRVDSRDGSAWGGQGNDFIGVMPAAVWTMAGGNGGDDVLYMQGTQGARLFGHGGDDKVTSWLESDTRDFYWSGGAGRDEFGFSTFPLGVPRGTTMRILDGQIKVEGLGRMGRYAGFTEVQPVDERGLRWVFHGTDERDDFEVDGIPKSLDARTFGGRDLVRGTTGRDRLDLGSGRDKARAGLGRDVCVSVEVAVACEVRR